MYGWGVEGLQWQQETQRVPFCYQRHCFTSFAEIWSCYLVRCKRSVLFQSVCCHLGPFLQSGHPSSLGLFLEPLFFASYTEITAGLPSAPPGYKGTCCERARSVTSLFSLLLCHCAAVLFRAHGRRCQFFCSFRMGLCQVLETGPIQC